jgi:hypothetical protein
MLSALKYSNILWDVDSIMIRSVVSNELEAVWDVVFIV